MNLNKLVLPLGILSGLLTSCIYPYPPNPRAPLAAQSPDPLAESNDDPVTSAEQERIREQREKARREAAARRRSDDSSSDTPPPRKADPSPPPKKDYRTAQQIPGKEGFVFNPFTNNPVDVRAIPPGTLVRDPQDPNPDHKFRVP